MANLLYSGTGTVLDTFPFWHLQDLDSDSDSIDSNIISNIKDNISNDITLPFPDALHVVHINAEDIICHFGDIYQLFSSSGIHIILVGETWL